MAPASAPRYLLAISLFLLTLFATTTLGAGWYLSTRTDVTTDLVPFLTPRTITAVWSDPDLLATGLMFSLPALFILLCHELGHYLTCRRYGLPVTLPYFIPAPLGLGTLGAFIKIKSRIRSKQELLDVGASGPIAGFLALLPFLLYGVAKSQPATVQLAAENETSNLVLLLPGKSLGIELAVRLFHGELPEGVVMDLHPFALAAWVGLLATALNLLPLGQLDGGHILYAANSKLQRQSVFLLWGALALAGLFLWPGWILWCVVVLIVGLRHPRLIDENKPLDRRRRLIAFACLILFVLSFMPIPVSLVPIVG
jgi:membrane-associated protease RseP (regulator of RpoE activity)